MNCETCEIRKYYARAFDIHFDYMDCPCECPFDKGVIIDE